MNSVSRIEHQHVSRSRVRPDTLLKTYGITDSDLKLVRGLSELDAVRPEHLVADFYVWLHKQPWFAEFFGDAVPERVRIGQIRYWAEFLAAQIDERYVESRLAVGNIHAVIDLPVMAYTTAMAFSQSWLAQRVQDSGVASDVQFKTAHAVALLCQLDVALVMDAYAERSAELTREQARQSAAIASEAARVAIAASEGKFGVAYTPQGNDEEIAAAMNRMVGSFKDIVTRANEISRGDYTSVVTPRSEADELGIALQTMTETLRQIAQMAEAMAEGNLDVRIAAQGDQDVLANALNRMVDNLSTAQAKNEQDAWLKNAQTEVFSRMRGEQDMKSLCTSVLNFLAPTLEAAMGVIYVANETGHLELGAGYACADLSALRESFAPGEGLIGQTAAEQQPRFHIDVSDDPVHAPHGLGHVVLPALAVVPLITAETVWGVLQLASAKPLTSRQIELLNVVTENIAIALASAHGRDKTEALFRESQAAREELQSQSEELRVTNEELESQTNALKTSQATLQRQQAELQESNSELEEKTEHLERQKRDIEAMNADIRQAQMDLEQRADELSQSSKYKSEFLANMSHELRTPLNSLLLLAQELSENAQGNLTNQQVEAAKIIHSGGEDLLRLINDILDLSKVEAGKLSLHVEPVKVDDLASALERQFDRLAANAGLAFYIDVDNGIHWQLTTDADRLLQVLKNLLANAIKFTTKGSVTLRIHAPAPDTRFCNAGLLPATCLAFSVTDTGIGIPTDKLSAIFEAFQQGDGSTSRKYGGTGLGLTISKQLAVLLGGEIQVASTEGQGSTFTLYVPIETRAETPPAAPTRSEPDGDSRVASEPAPSHESPSDMMSQTTPGMISDEIEHAVVLPDDRRTLKEGDRAILIVEDHAPSAQALMGLVQKKGYKCITVGTGKGALQLANHYKPSGILLDLGLPDLSGLSVLEQLKCDLATRHIPVHIVSGREQTAEPLRRGAVGYLQKPVTPGDLQAVIGKFETLWATHLKQILVVEDDPENRDALVRLLDNKGVHIETVSTGQDAIQRLKTEAPDCLVLDLGLPDMSGFDILTVLEATEQHTPVIVYTGRDLSDDELVRLEDYAASVVVKSAQSPARLVDEVSLFLHSVEASLSPGQREIVQRLHDPTTILEGRKVLVVDDDLRNTFALSGILQRQGMKVLKAENGQVALDLLRDHASVDLVIMDIMMPVMDGYRAMEHIRAQPRYAELPIIALTANAMPEDRQACLDAGATDYLTKPLDPENLLALMRMLLFDKTA